MNKEPELVDLGLPSGNLWMTHNFGTFCEAGLGLYYQFGSLVGYQGEEALKHSYWETCPFNDGKDRFNRESFLRNRYKLVYKNGLLRPEFDIVTQNYGKGFKIPAKEDFLELVRHTTHRNDSKGIIGVNGILFTSKTNGNTMFIPFSGRACAGGFRGIGNYCNLWSDRLHSNYPDCAYGLYYDGADLAYSIASFRFYSFAIRGIKVRNE